MKPVDPEKRRSMRQLEWLQAFCIRPNGSISCVVMSNLATNGCCILGDELDLKVGHHVALKPDGFSELRAVVRWASDGNAGVEFLRPLRGSMAEFLQRTPAT